MRTPADILVVQFVGHISLDVRRFINDEVERLRGPEVRLCIIDGLETARLLTLARSKASVQRECNGQLLDLYIP
jgi:hypothetical protein